MKGRVKGEGNCTNRMATEYSQNTYIWNVTPQQQLAQHIAMTASETKQLSITTIFVTSSKLQTNVHTHCKIGTGKA